MLGIARSLLRLGRKDEAKRAFESARAAYESGREAFDASLDGRGKEFWAARMREIEGEF